MNHAANGKHSETSILNLLQLHLIHFLLALSNTESHGIEAEVTRLAVGIFEHVLHGNLSLVGPPFEDTEPADDLKHGTGSSRRGGHVGVGNGDHTGQSPVLLHNETNGGEHGSASVLDLGFTEPLHVEIFGEAQRVKADITNPALGSLRGFDEGDSLAHLGIEGEAVGSAHASGSEGGCACHKSEGGESAEFGHFQVRRKVQ
mmetsp:Transcript_10244/g.15265  ORF Transcript_10244/g.15265 Transcript_10244/m.15265 type:complete len:202 (+) Transcript_10244:299-904(+)